MSPTELREFLESLGWHAPRGKKLYFTRSNGVRLRITLGARTVRIHREVKVVGLSEWQWLGGDFYSRIDQLPNERVRIGSLILEKNNVDGMGSAGKPGVL